MSLRSEGSAQGALAGEYSQSERGELLQLAHETIEGTLRNQRFAYKPSCAHLCELRGAFTTLHLGDKLRGCVGYVLPVYPLFQTIVETATAAAFNDKRFSPITLAEIPRLRIEISVLSSLFSIAPQDVVLGVHGLVVSMGASRGLLLPQVPVEWNWDRETFLAQTCRKAGLAMDAWQRGAVLEAFTAEIFGDPISEIARDSAQ
jgi:AmmeMemoRadiSam system protein A